MDGGARNIFKAIHEQKLLSVEYRNASGDVTHYWMGILDVDPRRRTLSVKGMHLLKHSVMSLTVRIDSILASSIVEGTYFRTPKALLTKLEKAPETFEPIFGSVFNLKILDYLADCSKLDAPALVRDYELIPRLDEDSFKAGLVTLDDEQFGKVIESLHKDARHNKNKTYVAEQRLALNVLSLRTNQGLYLLAYRELRLDVERRAFVIGNNIVFCHEFVVNHGKTQQRMTLRRFLDDDDLALLDHRERDLEEIKDRIAAHCDWGTMVDDLPYVFKLTRYASLNLEREYDAIASMCTEGKTSYPIRAFFGNLTRRPVRRKEYPLVLADARANLDQLLAINQGMRFPLTYVQGPPGTGKTSTIVNTLVNAFFNGRTVLFASYNNHPVDGVCKSLASFEFHGKAVPFPMLRLGNRSHVSKSLKQMYDLYVQARQIGSSSAALDELRVQEADKTSALIALLNRYEERVDYDERRACIIKLLETNHNLNFNVSLEERQLADVDRRLKEYESFDEMLAEAHRLVAGDHDTLMGYLYLRSARMIRRLGEPRNSDLLDIVKSAAHGANALVEADAGFVPEAGESPELRFSRWLREESNLKRLLRIFPLVATTCISACRLGNPNPLFDLCVIDEASQCDTATALVPIVRAHNLMLVGDPQQLNPVVAIDRADNDALKHAYGVTDEYDYVDNSVYKVFLACDAVSNEILLREHYRCDEQIIEYNNRKYYNGQLKIRSGRHAPDALTFIDVDNDAPSYSHKNVAPAEANVIVRYARDHPDRSIGVITPFNNQSRLIGQMLEAAKVTNATCGTVHSFQGDEKDVVLFSLALTKRTREGTYRWLCSNRELINVATSRARDRLILVSNQAEVERLHQCAGLDDDLYELVRYVMTRGHTELTPRAVSSRALGVKPYSTKTESAFLETLSHALDNIFVSGVRHVVHHEVPIAQVFESNPMYEPLFYSGRFDFVVYEAPRHDTQQIPILAIELDGKEHQSSESVRERDRRKERICQKQGFQLIRVENSYARRYHYIKDILVEYFERA